MTSTELDYSPAARAAAVAPLARWLAPDDLLPERIARRVVRDPVWGCWLWTGTKLRGYGRVWSSPDRAQVLVHRLVVELTSCAPIPRGLVVDHLCGTPACCHPFHLEATTQRENVRRYFRTVPTCPRGHSREGREWNTKCRDCARERDRARYRNNPARRAQQLATSRARRERNAK